MLVEVIASRSQDIVWRTTLDGHSVSNDKIRRVSIDKFYELVTGDSLAFKRLCEALPKVIEDVVNSAPLTDAQNTVIEELLSIDENLLKSIYLLTFKTYEGFNDFNI
jgi:hypothetical protein